MRGLVDRQFFNKSRVGIIGARQAVIVNLRQFNSQLFGFIHQFFPMVSYSSLSLYHRGFCGASHKNKGAVGNTLLSLAAQKEITGNNLVAHTIAQQILQR